MNTCGQCYWFSQVGAGTRGLCSESQPEPHVVMLLEFVPGKQPKQTPKPLTVDREVEASRPHCRDFTTPMSGRDRYGV